MSDCHRGEGNNYDNFLKNENVYNAALRYYLDNNYIYIELGDGDDLWEVKNVTNIINEHASSFKLLKEFYQNNRLIMLYGNHDIVKRNKDFLKKEYLSKGEELFQDIEVYEGLTLKYQGHDIFLVHGHQVDFFNSSLWKVARFLVRYIWRYVEFLGIKDPTSAAKNNKVAKKAERKLEKFSNENNTLLITGHTHRPVYPKVGESLYFNDGSCVHPNGITCIEIEYGHIALVKWHKSVNREALLNVERTVLSDNIEISKFFNNIIDK